MLSERIRELRKKRDWTQTELGKRVGVIKQTVSSWENGTSTPHYDIVCKLAEVFEVSTDYLCGKSNNYSSKASTKKYNHDTREDELVLNYRQLSSNKKADLLRYSKYLLDSDDENIDETKTKIAN